MATQAQFTANRANAQQSTGPKSFNGKATSSMNALRTGIYSAKVLLPGEDPAVYEEMRRNLMEENRPANTIELMCVELVAQSWWRMQRATRLSQEALEESLTGDGDQSRYQRFEALREAIERSWKRACDHLQKIQANRIRTAQRERATQAKKDIAKGDQEFREFVFSPMPGETSEEIGFVPNNDARTGPSSQ